MVSNSFSEWNSTWIDTVEQIILNVSSGRDPRPHGKALMFHQWSVTWCKESSEWITPVKWSLSDIIAFIDPNSDLNCTECQARQRLQSVQLSKIASTKIAGFFRFPSSGPTQFIVLSFSHSLGARPSSSRSANCPISFAFYDFMLSTINSGSLKAVAAASMQFRNPATLHHSSTTLPEPVAASFKARLNLSRLSTFSENF